MRDFLGTNYGKDFDNAFGKGTGKAIMHATAGRCVKAHRFLSPCFSSADKALV